MKIAVYDCVKGDALTEKYGPTGNHVIRWIEPHLPEATYVSVHVAGPDAPPSPGEGNGIIISGSEKGVYDDPPWMQPLRANLQAHRAHGTPMFGICFGHQLMADVFGGKAEKANHVFAAGSRRFDIGGVQTPAYVAHQDQVTQVPPGAQITASAPYYQAAALSYDFPALSVPVHPEYNADFPEELLELFGNDMIHPADISAAPENITRHDPHDLSCPDVAAVYRVQLAVQD